MDRREFLKKCVAYGTAAVGATLLRPVERILAAPLDTAPDLVAVMGGRPAELFDAGIAALGGMRAFVKSGQTVAIKPNISWSAPPERGATTNPELIRRIVEHCREAGAKRVYVFDNTISSWQTCYRETGAEAAAKAAGAQMAPAHSTGYYHAYTVMTSGGPQGSSYRAALELRKMQILSADIVAANAAASRVLGHAPEDIQYIPLASDLRLGRKDLSTLKIQRITL